MNQFFKSRLLLLMASGWLFSTANAAQVAPQLLATNISGLRNAITGELGCICAYDLQGTILAVDTNSGSLFFKDDSGTVVLETTLKDTKLEAGQNVQISGTNYVSYTDIGIGLGTGPVIDADQLHSMIERYNKIYLKAGLHPIQVKWFNQTAEYSLQVAYSATNISKQLIPPSSLFRTANASGPEAYLPGLFYRCFEGTWDELPDFNSLMPKKNGIVSNFDIAVRTRDENVGLEFTGFLKIPAAGEYTFYLGSDDGSQLFLDDMPPEINIIGRLPVPDPRPIAINQPLLDRQDSLWGEVEGQVTFISRYKDHVKLELASGENHIQVEVLSGPTEIPYLMNSRVRIRGVCLPIKNIDGQTYTGALVAAGWGNIRILNVADDQWSTFKKTTISELYKEKTLNKGGIAYLHGSLFFDSATHAWRFKDATGSANITLLNELSADKGLDMECLARWSLSGTNLLLNEAVVHESFFESSERSNSLPVLTTALQVQQLGREEANRNYPVQIRGVVTYVRNDFGAFIVQDLTRAVFVWAPGESSHNLPYEGDYCDVTGISQSADFSPIVALQKVRVFMKGQMPQPIVPTRNQLISGSLDAQYIEIRGLVIAANDTFITLLTSDGTLNLDIEPKPVSKGELINSIIRVRGCLFANWNGDNHRVIVDEPLRIRNAAVSIDAPPPADLFKADKARVENLMQFDVRFDAFRWVKISGQIIHCSADMDYLMDDTTGLRFQLAQPLQFNPGDLVEAVGLVDLRGASPVLRQAVARKTGHSRLPQPRPLSINSLSNNFDSTLVGVEGTLVNFQSQGTSQLLELQVGLKSFLARGNFKPFSIPDWDIGSRVKVTGTFHALDGDQLAGEDVNSFELLLNSPLDVQVIARAPWWTLRRLLIVVTGLLTGLTLAFIWIALLRQQVGRRTQQLEREISERENTEKLRAIEQERSRIARDLHDDLGSTLTEIGMMATASPGLKIASTATERLQQIAEKSRLMISALDGVVWVVNSKNDTLSSLMEYIASYAEEFIAKVQIACRVELPKFYSERIIAAEIRHDTMLAVREILNNAVRHGRPNEVLLRLTIITNKLEIMIKDDGCGFDPARVSGNGLNNLKQRMAKSKGTFQIQSSPQQGTTVTLHLPLPG